MQNDQFESDDNHNKVEARPFMQFGPLSGCQPSVSRQVKESWAICYPVCPKCGQQMVDCGSGWHCPERAQNSKSLQGCGRTDTSGKWRVAFFSTVPIVNRQGRQRLYARTVETWPNEQIARERVEQLRMQFYGIQMQQFCTTWLTRPEFMAAEKFFGKYSLEQLEFAEQLFSKHSLKQLKFAEALIDHLKLVPGLGISN